MRLAVADPEKTLHELLKRLRDLIDPTPLDLEEHDGTCRRCHTTCSIDPGDDWTPLCHHCAQEVLSDTVPVLLDAAKDNARLRSELAAAITEQERIRAVAGDISRRATDAVADLQRELAAVRAEIEGRER